MMRAIKRALDPDEPVQSGEDRRTETAGVRQLTSE